MERPYDEELELYLDGALDGRRRATFEGRLARDERLRAEVELQRALDASLRGTFAPPASTALVAGARYGAHVGAGDGASGRRPWRALAIAAAVAIALFGFGWSRWSDRPVDPSDADPGRRLAADEPTADPAEPATKSPPALAACRTVRADWVELYTGLAAGGVACSAVPGFGPAWSATLFDERLALAGGDARIDRRIADARLGPETAGFEAHVGGGPALLFVTRAEHDPRPLVGNPEGADGAPGDGLFLHRCERGGLVLYELTPRSEPGLLPQLELAAR